MSKLIVISETPDKLCDWTNTSTTDPTTRKRRIRVSAPITHMLFEKCVECTDDPFWINIFSQAKDNKFPSKFSYKDGLLIYKHGQKISQFPLSLNPKLASKEFMLFLQDKGGILSDLDRKKIQEEAAPKKNTPITWSSMRKKFKDQSRSDFIERERIKHNLTQNELKHLIQILNYGFGLKYFNVNSIELENYTISNIRGLSFDEKTRKYDIDTTIVSRIKRPPTKIKPVKVEHEWYDERWIIFHAKIIADTFSICSAKPKNKVVDKKTKYSSDSDYSESNSVSDLYSQKEIPDNSSRIIRIKT